MVTLKREVELDGDGGVDRYREGDGVADEGSLRGGREVGGVVAGGAGGGVDRVKGEVELVGVDAAVGVDGVEGAGPVAGEGAGGLGVGGRGSAEQEEGQGGEVVEYAVGHLSLGWGLRFIRIVLDGGSVIPSLLCLGSNVVGT